MRSLLVLVMLAGTAAADPLAKECDAQHGKPARATPDRPLKLKSSGEPLRTVAVRRYVVCGYWSGKLTRTIEHVYLYVASQDRPDAHFSTGFAGVGPRYFIECENAIQLVNGKLAYQPSCVHEMYDDKNQVHRITGVDSYKGRLTTLELAAASTSAVTLAFDATIGNPYETVHFKTTATGPVTTTVQTFDCAPQGNTKKAVPEACR
jgi:hypothetical protein